MAKPGYVGDRDNKTLNALMTGRAITLPWEEFKRLKRLDSLVTNIALRIHEPDCSKTPMSRAGLCNCHVKALFAIAKVERAAPRKLKE